MPGSREVDRGSWSDKKEVVTAIAIGVTTSNIVVISEG